MRAVLVILAAAPLLLANAAAPAQPCEPDYRVMPYIGELSGIPTLYCLEEIEFGGRTLLYAGTEDYSAPGPRTCVFAWDGRVWTAIGDTFEGVAYAITSFDSGAGPVIYATGDIYGSNQRPVNNIASWDGNAWKPLGDGTGLRRNGQTTNAAGVALAVFDDGNGPALYVGGAFNQADGIPVNGLARWNGQVWSAVEGSPTNGSYAIRAMRVFDDGAGPHLFIGGEGMDVGEVYASLCWWNGRAWRTDDSAGLRIVGAANSLELHDDGAGPALYIGGDIRDSTVPFPTLRYIARWDGDRFSAVGQFEPFGSEITALCSAPTPDGPRLFATGDINLGGPYPSDEHVAVWDGVEWSIPGGGVPHHRNFPRFHALESFNDGDGSKVFLGGLFFHIEDIASYGFASWDGHRWSNESKGLNGAVETVSMAQVGDEASIFAGGVFRDTGSLQMRAIGRWADAQCWTDVGGGLPYNEPGVISAIASHDEGEGPVLFAAGRFEEMSFESPTMDHIDVSSIARWNGEVWSDVGGGALPGGSFHALASFDFGAGAELVAAGAFGGGMVQAPLARSIAAWNGSTWRALADGLNARVLSLAVYDDGSGESLYAGGEFSYSGLTPASRIARWNGASWEQVGTGLLGAVRALAAFDGGAGPRLFAGGDFGSIPGGGVVLSRIAMWNGTSWNPAAQGLNGRVHAMFAGELDGKPVLWIGGEFQGAYPGLPSAHLIGWNGVAWIRPASAPDATVRALAWDPSTNSLWIGGDFLHVGETPSSHIARLDACALVCAGDANGDTLVDFADLVIIVDSINSSGAGLPGDVDYDGDVDFADLNLVLSVFNTEC